MAEKIYENISEISKAIKGLNKEAQSASISTKSLNEDLKLDPKNVDLARQRFDALNRELQAYTAYQQKLIEHENMLRSSQIAGVERLKTLDKSSEEYIALEKELQRYNQELTKTEKAADRAATQIKRLNASIKGIEAQKLANEAEKAKKKLDNLRNGCDELQKAARKLQVMLVLLVGTIAKLTKEAIEQGTELYTLSQRYRTSTENIQLWNRALQVATGENDLFTTSLKVMSKGLSAIPVGRGVAYNNALKGIGVSYKEIQDLDPTAQFERILNGLQSVTNESLQGSYALTLFGESGQTIINALQSSSQDIEYYLEQARQFAPITQESAEVLTKLGFQIDAARSQIQVATAELAINAAPMIVQIIELLNKTVMPLLVGLTKHSWLLYIAVLAVISLKVVPALIKWIMAVQLAKTEQDKYTMSILMTKAAALGLIGIIGGIAFGIGSAALQSKKSLDDLAQTASEAYGGISGDLDASVSNYATTSTERTITINVDIHGEGDTAPSDEGAQTVAQLTVDELQKRLGDLIK